MRLFRRVTPLGWALLLLTAASAPAQEERLEPARFLIETITVEGPKEAAANIVRAETLLQEGRSYTEADLRQAVDRVQRLPFVLYATFALRKGSERGAYELAVQVQSARWFFFDQWNRGFYLQEPLSVNPANPDSLGGFRQDFEAGLGGLVGARLFVGRSGVVFAALDLLQGAQIGFTQYDLFHRGILFSAGVSRGGPIEVLPLALDPTFAAWDFWSATKLSLGTSIPLGGRQSVQVSLSEQRGEPASRRSVLLSVPFTFPAQFSKDGEVTYRTADAKWVYDTSDDPLLPTRGTSLSVGIETAHFRGQGLRLDSVPSFDPPLPAFESEQAVLAFSAIRHWSITPRQTVSATGRAAVGQSNVEGLVTDETVLPVEETLDYTGGSLGLQHSLVLKRSREPGDVSDLRLETGVEAGAERTSPDLGPGLLRRFSASVGIVFRNQWGRVRAILTYLDLRGEEP
jgi:hypothetical protein